MSVKVIIKRIFKNTPLLGDYQTINKIRNSAMQRKGYITGETLVSKDDNSVVVLSTWSNMADWQSWLNSRERAELEAEITPYLKEPSTSQAFMTSAEYKLNEFIE